MLARRDPARFSAATPTWQGSCACFGLVLTATSGGVNFKPFKHEEWRDQYRREYPGAADWITSYRVDLTDQLSRLRVPTLLLWSDTDAISPLAIGKNARIGMVNT